MALIDDFRAQAQKRLAEGYSPDELADYARTLGLDDAAINYALGISANRPEDAATNKALLDAVKAENIPTATAPAAPAVDPYVATLDAIRKQAQEREAAGISEKDLATYGANIGMTPAEIKYALAQTKYQPQVFAGPEGAMSDLDKAIAADQYITKLATDLGDTKVTAGEQLALSDPEVRKLAENAWQRQNVNKISDADLAAYGNKLGLNQDMIDYLLGTEMNLDTSGKYDIGSNVDQAIAAEKAVQKSSGGQEAAEKLSTADYLKAVLGDTAKTTATDTTKATTSTVTGGQGNDTIKSTTSTVTGGKGNDTISGGGAGDTFTTRMQYGEGMGGDRVGTGVALGEESGLRSGYAPYVQRMLERASAEADVPFQKYMGESPLLESARAGIANLTTPAQFQQGSNLATAAGIGALGYGQYKPTSFITGTFANPAFNPQVPEKKAEGGLMSLKRFQTGDLVVGGSPTTTTTNLSGQDVASGQPVPSLYPVNYGGQNVTNVQASYMSPYMQGVVDPALREAKRQSEIQGMTNAAKFTQAGAFGGTRNVLADAERQRNLMTQLGDIQGMGLQKAYESGLGQFNVEQNRGLEAQKMAEQSRQFGSELGLKGLQTGIQAGQVLGGLGTQQGQLDLATLRLMGDLGKEQRDFDYQEFLRGEKYPYENLRFMQSMLQGLPISAAPTGIDPMSQALSGGISSAYLANLLGALGGKGG